MIKLLATDLDGTILNRHTPVHPDDIATLEHLGKAGVIRIAATGRTLQSAFNVLPDNFPIDYLVFSSGAGIYCWQEKKLLQTKHLGFDKTKALIEVFNSFKVEYTLHHPIPQNHLFFHPEGNDPHPDFERYLEFNHANAEVINSKIPKLDYTQTLAFVPNMDVFNSISSKCSDFDVKIIRATSPIDGKSIWMECFHPDVSKASGILEICKLKGIDDHQVVAIGNDFNDLDMLNHFDHSFVVKNSPEELKDQFQTLTDSFNAPLKDWFNRFNS